MILDELNKIIERRGISGAELARRIGMDQKVLWNRLHGRSRLTATELLLLAEELDIDLDDLSHRYYLEFEASKESSEEVEDA